jgi:hypothetical protein
MSHAKAEQAFLEYISQIADFLPPDEEIICLDERKMQENTQLAASYESKLKALDAKDKETLELYLSNELTFDEYRGMRTKISADRLVLSAEIERIKSTESAESKFRKEDIILNLRENWELLTDAEKRVFLRNFVEKIVVESTKGEGEYFADVSVREVVFRME